MNESIFSIEVYSKKYKKKKYKYKKERKYLKYCDDLDEERYSKKYKRSYDDSDEDFGRDKKKKVDEEVYVWVEKIKDIIK